MRNEPSYGRHARRQEDRPPWLTHPKKSGMPKLFRKILLVIAILALLALGYYIYLLLNPEASLVAKRV